MFLYSLSVPLDNWGYFLFTNVYLDIKEKKVMYQSSFLCILILFSYFPGIQLLSTITSRGGSNYRSGIHAVVYNVFVGGKMAFECHHLRHLAGSGLHYVKRICSEPNHYQFWQVGPYILYKKNEIYGVNFEIVHVLSTFPLSLLKLDAAKTEEKRIEAMSYDNLIICHFGT